MSHRDMKLKKAVQIAERGPRTEAQRQQAIATLRRHARATDDQDLASVLSAAATRLVKADA